jgi:phage terminase large subunit
MFQRTQAVNKLLKLSKRKRVIQGGTWAGKTYGIIACIIDRATKNPGLTGTVVAETIPALKSGALKDFKKIMLETGRWREDRFNGSELHYTFASGYKLEFKSFDSVGKAQQAGKRDDLFINEGPYIPFDIADALIMRTEQLVWIDFNPTAEFWAHTEILTNPDAEFLLLKYHDNEALPETILQELKLKQEKAKTSSYWANWCRVYIDGEIGNLQGVVFPEYELVDEIPTTAKRSAYGLDWGFANDPTALIDVRVEGDNVYLDELIYSVGLTNADLVREMDRVSISKNFDIIADSADPKSIQDLSDRGYYNVYPAKKGEDSVRAGIDRMREKKLFITKRSLNLIKEFRAYRWKTDKDGKTLSKPEDNNNHGIDAVRYVFLTRLKEYVSTWR